MLLRLEKMDARAELPSYDSLPVGYLEDFDVKFPLYLLWLSSLLFIGGGIWLFAAPGHLPVIATGMPAGVPGAASNLISPYGGMSIGVGLLLGLCARRPSTVHLGLVGSLLILGAIAASTLVGSFVTGPHNATPFMPALLGAELTYFILGISALKQLRAKSSANGQSHDAPAKAPVAGLNAELPDAELRRLAFHDALTGLPNRVLLGDRMRQALARADREQREVAILFIDLDHFKEINDSFGHFIGDQVLRATAERLVLAVRQADTVARLGGDEFVLLLEDDSAASAATVASKLLAHFAFPMACQGHHFTLTPSIGISVYPRDGCEIETLLNHADSAMYEAKKASRNAFAALAHANKSACP